MAVRDHTADFIEAYRAAYAALEDGRNARLSAECALRPNGFCDWSEQQVARIACERAVADFTFDRKRRAA